MIDQRDSQLADILVNYSIRVKPKEKIEIRTTSHLGLPLVREVFKKVLDAGAYPYVNISDEGVSKYFYDHATQDQLTAKPEIAEFVAKWAEKSITVVADINTRELSNTNAQNMLIRAKVMKPVRDISMKKPWVLTWYPTPASAQDAGMGGEEFQDFYYGACLRDWNKEKKRLQKLAGMLNDSEKIEVIGERTRLTLSAKGRVFIPCAGEFNMPDGEVFTAPVDDSVEGEVYFNFPLLRQGKMIRDIHLRFEKGRVVRADASENKELLDQILDTDEGARRLGEFAIGTNPGIQTYLNNVLFDEKILGTIHMAVGEAYEECNGVNKSAIHMDIVKNMKPTGSVVRADGKLVLKDGKLVV